MSAMRGYCVSGPEPTEHAVLVFAQNSKAARRMGAPYIVGELGIAWIEVQARWLRDANDADWPGEGARVIQPPVCEGCDLWNSKPLANGYCEACDHD